MAQKSTMTTEEIFNSTSSDGEHRRQDEGSPHNTASQDRETIGKDTLVRYSGTPIEDFQEFVLLTNFPRYVTEFGRALDAEVVEGPVLQVSHSPEQSLSIINYSVGAPMAALVMDVLSHVKPQCVVMLGLCGGLHRRVGVGDFLLPVAAIRDEGASMHYLPQQVPSLPAFMVQQFISQELQERHQDFHTGVLHSTDYRMWEFDDNFRTRLRQEKATAIDMECSALFSVGFAHKVPVGALMLISDLPLEPGGVKTAKSAAEVFDKYTEKHLEYGIAALCRMREANRHGEINFRRFVF